MNTQQTKVDYNKVVNRPVTCIYCGSQVMGKSSYSPQGTQQIRWVCERCNQLVKIGNV
jgi:ribosomal protein S27AE